MLKDFTSAWKNETLVTKEATIKKIIYNNKENNAKYVIKLLKKTIQPDCNSQRTKEKLWLLTMSKNTSRWLAPRICWWSLCKIALVWPGLYWPIRKKPLSLSKQSSICNMCINKHNYINYCLIRTDLFVI